MVTLRLVVPGPKQPPRDTSVTRDEPLISKTQVFAPDLVKEIRGFSEGTNRAIMGGNLYFSRNQEGYGNFFHNFGKSMRNIVTVLNTGATINIEKPVAAGMKTME